MDQNQDLLRRLLEERDAARAERDAARAERDAAKAERDAAKEERDAEKAARESAEEVANARISRNAEVNYAAAEANFPMYGFSVYIPYLKLGCREQALTAYNHCRNRGT